MAEAEAEIGHGAPRHRLADGGLLGDQPGVFVLLPDIHRPAHHHERVVAVERRDRLTLVELDRVPAHPVRGHEVAEDGGMLDGNVLKDEQAHGEPRPAA